ncbi:MAG TPA: hypothetical protein VM695_11955 [Phycisphaerae bacterium]|nr:hypothetical protein [Phycisphaerae bacterium]
MSRTTDVSPGRRGRKLLLAAAIAVSGAWLVWDPPPVSRAGRRALRMSSSRARGDAALLQELAAGLGPAVAGSREVLLGDPDSARTQWIRLRKEPRFPPMPSNAQGGPGARMLYLHGTAPRSLAPLRQWRQTTLREVLAQWHRRNSDAADAVKALQTKAAKLTARLRGRDGVPGVQARSDLPRQDHWPAHCLDRLNAALGARDPAAARLWAEELSAALFALADLHRWLDYLIENHEASLDFATRCSSVFTWADGKLGPGLFGLNEWLPSYSMLMPRIQNYLEVERQAQGLLGPVQAPAALEPCEDPAAVYLPEDVREAFLLLRSRLAPRTQAVWNEAAHTPFERSYLVNMLRRTREGQSLDQFSVVLRRFETNQPAPTVTGLMDVLFYRASVTECLEAGDRFDDRLVDAARRLAGANESVLGEAHKRTHDLLGGWANYRGGIWTLREMLDLGKLDCVRGTDAIGALYRNAGRTGFHVLRVTCGNAGHTLAAADVAGLDGAKSGRVLLADALADQAGEESWPSAFYRGFAWPAGYPGRKTPAFAVELLARGLDNYVFAEGYVVCGPHAGELTKAAVPYLPGHEKATVQQVYRGPYPNDPTTAGAGAAGL